MSFITGLVFETMITAIVDIIETVFLSMFRGKKTRQCDKCHGKGFYFSCLERTVRCEDCGGYGRK